MSTQVQQGYQGDGFGKVDGGFEIVEHNEISLTSTNPNGSTSNDDISMWGFGGVSKGYFCIIILNNINARFKVMIN